jgi:iron complex outermembrane receptor protein
VVAAQDDVVALDTLQVQVGSRASPSLPLRTRSIQLLGAEEVRNLPVRTVPDLLGWATGVEVSSRSPAQHDLSVRGGGFEQVVVLVNGVRMSDPQTGHFDLNLAVPVDQVARVEVLRGPASALYGADAVGGVVNVVTRAGARPRSVRLEAGSWGTLRLSAGGGVGEEGESVLRASGEMSRSDGHRPGTDFEAALLHLTGSTSLGGGRLSADVGLSRRDFGARDFYAPYPSFERTRTVDASVRWTGREGEGGWMEAGTSFRRHGDEFILLRHDPSFYRNEHTSSQAGADLLARTRLGGARLAFGVEAFAHLLRSNSLGNREEGRGALFGEMALGRGRRGALSVGLRGDWHQGFGVVFSPSVSASHRLARNLRVRTALGRSFRAPTWTERHYRDPVNVGREDLAPERAWSGEVGADLFLGSGARLAVTAFGRRATDLIDWARPVGGSEEAPWEARNVEEATFTGVEADLTLAGPLDVRWSLGASLLSLREEERADYLSKYALRPVMEDLLVRARRSFPGGVEVSVQGRRTRRRGEEPYHLLGARVAFRLGDARLYLDTSNLTDQEYPDVAGAPAPGRAFFLGVETAWK